MKSHLAFASTVTCPEGGRAPSTAGQNQAVDRVAGPDVENDQRKSMPLMTYLTTLRNIMG